MAKRDWIVEIKKYEKGREAFNAALFSLSNGYVGTRGTDEETYAGAPRTFIAGLFNPDPVGIETMASVHNWLATRLFVDTWQFFYDVGKIRKYCKTLDMRSGCLTKTVETENRQGKITRIETLRFVSMHDYHLLGLRYRVTPLNYSGEITIQSGLDMRVASSGSEHFVEIEKGHAGNMLYNTVKANRSDTVVGMAASFATDFECTPEPFEHELQSWMGFAFQAKKGTAYTVDKLVSVYSSRDTEDPKESAVRSLKRTARTGFDITLEGHVNSWAELWDAHDVVIKGDPAAQHALRFCIYQLLSSGPNATEATNIGAKALTGDRYRGHVFWDTEIYLQPFYNLTNPEIAARLLMYRYNRLGAAKEKAKKLGARGACFVWESAETGKESIPVHWLIPSTGEVEILTFGDEEIHTSLDVAYAVWQYYVSTGDEDFLRAHGLELILESALFCASVAKLNSETGEYEIRKVTGPDEHHYGVNNSAYMNTMAKWNIELALRLLDTYEKKDPEPVQALLEKTGITYRVLGHMEQVVERIKVNFDGRTKLIEQFDGYFGLNELHRGSPNVVPEEKPVSKLIKQADVVLLLTLLSDQYGMETKISNYEYYEPHTQHESSLSASTHAILAAEIGKTKDAYDFMMAAARIDLKSGKADCVEGIHIGSCGGAWQAVVFGLGGLRITEDGLSLNPRLPKHWKSLSFAVQYKGVRTEFKIVGREIRINAAQQMKISVNGKQWEVGKGGISIPRQSEVNR